MKHSENIKAIIFDLDGTLVDSMWIWKQIDIDFLEKRGIDLPDDLQKSIEGMSFTETAQYFIERFELNEDIEAVKAEWNEMAKKLYSETIKLKTSVDKILDYAKANDIELGIGTSNSRELLEAVLSSHEIKPHFGSIRTSCEVEKGKPSPDIFLKVAEDLGVLPEECLVFEDTHAGVLAAKRAGMKAVAIYDDLSSVYEADIRAIADDYIMSFEDLF